MILLAADGTPGHGYAIIKDVAQRTGGTVRLQTGALYRALKHLLASALIEEWDPPRGEPSGDERRRYYRTTRTGHAVIDAELERMAAIVRSARAHRAPAPSRKPRLA